MIMSPITHDTLFAKRIQYLVILALMSALIAAGWFGYRWYSDRYEQAAYKDLAESIDGYHKALVSSQEGDRWTDVERAFTVGAERHQKSRLYPYFLAYKADALIHQGKQQEALAAMKSLTQQLPLDNPLYYLYKVKYALIKLDATDTATQQEGRQELIQFGQDVKNPVRDMALYQAGLDAWYKGNKEQAQKLWDIILNRSTKESHWYQLAQAKVRSEA